MYLGDVTTGVGEPVELGPGLLGQLVETRGELEVGEALRHPAQAGVDEPVAVADRLAAGMQDVLEPEGSAVGMQTRVQSSSRSP